MKSDIEKRLEKFDKEEIKKLDSFLNIYPPQIIKSNLHRLNQLARREEFRAIVLSNPLGLRVFLTIITPAEAIDIRVKFYELFNPLQDFFVMGLGIASDADTMKKPKWGTLARDLAQHLIDFNTIDNQKINGRPETITDLRKRFRQITTTENGETRIEEDHWPWAKVIKIFGQDKKLKEFHCYLKKEERWNFSNYCDELLINLMQAFDPPSRDRYYGEKDCGPLLCVYDTEGKRLDSFPFTLRGKYQSLIQNYVGKLPTRIRKDGAQDIEELFFKSILQYSKKKGPPPGYFKWITKHHLSETYQRLKAQKELESNFGSIELMSERSIYENASLLIDEVVTELLNKDQFRDEVDKVILQNYGKSDPEIANIVFKKTGKKMTGRGIQKRRVKNIEPALIRPLEIKTIVRMEEGRGRFEDAEGEE